MQKVAIDLTWVRHEKVGGTESYIRNLLDGFAEINQKDFKFVLLTSQDNATSFDKYTNNPCYELVVADVYSENQKKRVLWQNLRLGKLLRNLDIEKCFEPVYGKPFLGCRGIKYYTVIHDLQALHYPEYFSRMRYLWMRLSWFNAVRTSHKVIAISEYVRKDILEHFSVSGEKIITIHNPIVINKDELADINVLDKYSVKPNEYYYTVSSLLPHKNLSTIIKALAILKKDSPECFFPLVISGVGGKSQKELKDLCKANDVENDVIVTSFVNNDVRNRLYKECRAFLFPSIFEGFGMPPIEAMFWGTRTITTQETSLPEVTRGLCEYVKNAMDEKEWAELLQLDTKERSIACVWNMYDKNMVADFYCKLFFI